MNLQYMSIQEHSHRIENLLQMIDDIQHTLDHLRPEFQRLQKDLTIYKAEKSNKAMPEYILPGLEEGVHFELPSFGTDDEQHVMEASLMEEQQIREEPSTEDPDVERSNSPKRSKRVTKQRAPSPKPPLSPRKLKSGTIFSKTGKKRRSHRKSRRASRM